MKAESLSHYRIIKNLGAGGMGEVYLAEDTKLEVADALAEAHEHGIVHSDIMKC